MTDQTVELILGDFYLHGGIDEDWTVDLLADEFSVGAPAPVDVTVQTLLQNSSSVMTDRYDNREVTFKVRISAPDGVALAEGEAALFGELGKPNLLIWTPPALFAPQTVFRVITSSMEPEIDDLSELRARRVYSIRLVCEAFNRSVDEVTVEAEFQPESGGSPVTPIDTLVDACASTTGWSAVAAGSSVVASGGTLHTDPAVGYPRLLRTGSIDMSATEFLAVDVKIVGGGAPTVRLNATGSLIAPSGSGASTTAGYTRYFYRSPYTTITSVEVGYPFTGSTTGRIYAAEVRKRNSPPSAGTLRQKTFIAEVPGSAPSDGTLEVYHDTDGLGQVLLYTWPQDGGQGFTPALRELLSSSGTTTTDSALVSGARNDLAATAVAYAIPADQVAPGTYEVGAWLKSSTAATRPVTVVAWTEVASVAVREATFTTQVTFAASGTWYYVPLGRVELPVNYLPVGSDALVKVGFESSEASGIDVDEAYLFNVDSGALTVVDCEDLTRLWVNSATTEWPMPTILRGDAEDGSDSYSTGDTVTAWGVHEIAPPFINVFAVTPGALDAGVRLRLTPAWHTHAAS